MMHGQKNIKLYSVVSIYFMQVKLLCIRLYFSTAQHYSTHCGAIVISSVY